MMAIVRSTAWVIALASLASCASTKGDAGGQSARVGGLVANLRSSTSAVTGSVRAYEYRDGVQVQIAVYNLYPGQYRVAFHETPNCRSPNLISAGPPWAPPGAAKPAADLLPGFTANNDGSQTGYVVYVPGLHVDREPSLRGRSVVIHRGTSVGEAFPGQPNNRMACGVFEWTEAIL
jgi:Cu/Zn superoxide dismutase